MNLNLLEIYKYFSNQDNLILEMASFFAQEVNMCEEQYDNFCNILIEENIGLNNLASIIEENYGPSLCLEVYEDLLKEQSDYQTLIRKRNIEDERKRLGAQFVAKPEDTDAQRLSKSVRSLTTFKINDKGRFVQRDKQGDATKVRKDLEAKRTRSLSSKAKIDAAKATEKRTKQISAGNKVGAAKFVQNFKLAA